MRSLIIVLALVVAGCGVPSSNPAETPQLTDEPTGTIDPRLVGRWEEDASVCDQSLARYLLISYPSETEIVIAPGSFERLENHCRIPETAYFQGSIRGGLECFQEGEEYTEDADVVLASDDTLYFNGTPYFRCVDPGLGQLLHSDTPVFNQRAEDEQHSWSIIEYAPNVSRDNVRWLAQTIGDKNTFFFPLGNAPWVEPASVGASLADIELALSRSSPNGWSYSYVRMEGDETAFVFSDCLEQPRRPDARCR